MEKIPRLGGARLHGMLKKDYKIHPLLFACHFLNFSNIPSSFRCDRILSYGKGMRQLSYRRTELQLSDHRPVSAIYMVEVEEFCPRKLQRALTYTDAEIENEEVVAEDIQY